MSPAEQKAFSVIFGRPSVSLIDARIESVVSSVSVALRLASERDPQECDRLIKELDVLAARAAMKMGAV